MKRYYINATKLPRVKTALWKKAQHIMWKFPMFSCDAQGKTMHQ